MEVGLAPVRDQDESGNDSWAGNSLTLRAKARPRIHPPEACPSALCAKAPPRDKRSPPALRAKARPRNKRK
eukprot:4935991-Alexandrium_andersonii.AAC.1